MEKKLGRYLKPNEIVHHIDGNKQNNKLSNLKLMTEEQHKSLEMKQRPVYFNRHINEWVKKTLR